MYIAIICLCNGLVYVEKALNYVYYCRYIYSRDPIYVWILRPCSDKPLTGCMASVEVHGFSAFNSSKRFCITKQPDDHANRHNMAAVYERLDTRIYTTARLSGDAGSSIAIGWRCFWLLHSCRPRRGFILYTRHVRRSHNLV